MDGQRKCGRWRQFKVDWDAVSIQVIFFCRIPAFIFTESKFAGGHVASVRNLFSKQELGIVHFEAKREDAQQKFRNPNELEIHKQMFVKNFANYQLSDKRDELKEYIFLMEGKEDEFTTLKSLLLDYTYLYNNSDHRVKKFEFGTPIMRLLYLLNLPDQVIKVIFQKKFAVKHGIIRIFHSSFITTMN